MLNIILIFVLFFIILILIKKCIHTIKKMPPETREKQLYTLLIQLIVALIALVGVIYSAWQSGKNNNLNP